MDDVIPVRVNPTPPLGMSSRQVAESRSQTTRVEEERSSPKVAWSKVELPTYDEVMQDETRYHPVHGGTISGAPNFPEDLSSTSDSDSTHEGVYQVQDQPMGRNCRHNPPRGPRQDYLHLAMTLGNLPPGYGGPPGEGGPPGPLDHQEVVAHLDLWVHQEIQTQVHPVLPDHQAPWRRPPRPTWTPRRRSPWTPRPMRSPWTQRTPRIHWTRIAGVSDRSASFDR